MSESLKACPICNPTPQPAPAVKAERPKRNDYTDYKMGGFNWCAWGEALEAHITLLETRLGER